MPVLPNQRQELFAQGLAEGKTADEAYALAGYKPNRANASVLKSKQNISSRVQEILERAARRTEISVASVTEALLRIADKGEKLGEAAGLAVARAAHMDAAKLNGLVIDRAKVESEVRLISDQPLTADEWAAQHVPPALQ